MEKTILTVSDFIGLTNQTLEYAYSGIAIEGEVSSFKVNQGKYVFFDLKDDEGSIGCFMTVWQLRQPIEDGMKVVVIGQPKLTKWGKFSVTVQSVRPKGKGDIKKSFDILKAKLEKEGLFSADRKRSLPDTPSTVAVISSTQAAGYADFLRIVDDRWGGVHIDVAHVQVQGEGAADQVIRAIRYFNEREALPDVIVIIRGGGSSDDLSTFNDELLAREVAASRVPILTGIGHETDESLVDLVADRRAATPSNAAQILVPDRRSIEQSIREKVQSIRPAVHMALRHHEDSVVNMMGRMHGVLNQEVTRLSTEIQAIDRVLTQLNPRSVLERGYAIVRGEQQVGATIEIETKTAIMKAEVREYEITSKNR